MENIGSVADSIIEDVKRQLENKENETSYGEPQAWTALSNGRSIEVTLEQEGLAEEDYFYSVRLHCNEQEEDNNDYHSTVGVIGQFCSSGSSLDELDGLIRTAVSCNEKYPVAEHSLPEDIAQGNEHSLEILDSFVSDDQDMIYAVALEPGFVVDVKVCFETGLVYVMQNQDGTTVYDQAFADYTFPDYAYDEASVVQFVKETCGIFSEKESYKSKPALDDKIRSSAERMQELQRSLEESCKGSFPDFGR